MNEGKRVLCIGSGWIAARLRAYLSGGRGWTCRVLYQNFRNPDIPHDQLVRLPDSRQSWIELCRDWRPDYVVYLLGTAYVPHIEGNLNKGIADNVVCLAHFGDALSSAGIALSKMLVIGSSSVYGPSDAALSEEAAVAPTDTYGLIKAVQEQLALSLFVTRNLPVVVARQFNTTGPGQVTRFVVPSIAAQVAAAVRGGTSSGALRLRIGETAVRRDFLAIADTVAAYCRLLESARPGAVYNVCSGTAHSIGEMAQRACQLFGLRAEFDVQQELVRKGERRRPTVLGDPGRLRSLGWQPQRSLDQMITELVEFHIARGGAA